MNMNDAMNILYPTRTQVTHPDLVVGNHYIIDGECMKLVGIRGSEYDFNGAYLGTRVYHAEFDWSLRLLLLAYPALKWEIRDMQGKAKGIEEGASAYFERFGTSNE